MSARIIIREIESIRGDGISGSNLQVGLRNDQGIVDTVGR